MLWYVPDRCREGELLGYAPSSPSAAVDTLLTTYSAGCMRSANMDVLVCQNHCLLSKGPA